MLTKETVKKWRSAMERKIRAAHFGIGKMGSLMVRYAVAHGIEYVAAFSHNKNQIGKSLGNVVDMESLDIVISDVEEAEQVLKKCKPDICLISTQGSMKENKPLYEISARCGCDAISIGEWCLWPYTADKDLAEELDAYAKKYGVTLSASGAPEVIWGTMATTLCAATNRLKKIHGDCMLNIDDFGPSVSDMHGVDLSPEEFRRHFGPKVDMIDDHFPCAPGDQNAYLADHLGLHITKQTMEHIPIYADHDVVCHNRGDTIVKAGNAIGDYMAIISETEEGVPIEFFVGGKIYEDGDYDWVKWEIEGDPGYHLTLKNPATPQATCATPINRIPDVINAEPGFRVATSLPIHTYKSGSLEQYVKHEPRKY
jgi:hypothetical protein